MDVVQYPDTAGPYIPVLYWLRLQKMARRYKSLETEVTEMEKHMRRLHQANKNTNNAYRDFRRDLDLLEEELFRLMERHAVAETHAPIHQLNNDMKELSARID